MNRSRWIVVLRVAAAVIVALAVVGDRGDTPIGPTPGTNPQLPTQTLPSPFGAEGKGRYRVLPNGT